MRDYQRNVIRTLTNLCWELHEVILGGFVKEDQKILEEQLQMDITVEAFLARYPDLIAKYELRANPDWKEEDGRTISTKMKSFLQKLDEQDVDIYINFMMQSLEHMCALCKTCRRC
ncbi:MAG: hypothetical protein FWE25_00585 [Lachnospiraceae bacterium]|nr:hypothetical protein [Lachnospiraceae bacterium]